MDVYGQFLETAFACEFAEPVTIEHRRQFMGYQPDLNNNGLPLAREVMRFSFHSPTKQRHALKILKSQGVRWGPEMKAFVADNSVLFTYAHIKALKESTVHMTNRKFPPLWKFQTTAGILPMNWIRLKRHQPVWDWRGKEPSDDLVRNVDDVRHVKLEWVELDRERTSKQLTATQNVVAYDIETSSEYEAGEDSFSRPWRPRSHVINIGVLHARVFGSADAGHASDTSVDRRDVLVLGQTSPSRKCNIRVFMSEPEMLLTFLTEYVRLSDTIIDYNGTSFDWAYIFIRLELFRLFSGYRAATVSELMGDYRKARSVRRSYRELAQQLAQEQAASGEEPLPDKRAEWYVEEARMTLEDAEIQPPYRNWRWIEQDFVKKSESPAAPAVERDDAAVPVPVLGQMRGRLQVFWGPVSGERVPVRRQPPRWRKRTGGRLARDPPPGVLFAGSASYHRVGPGAVAPCRVGPTMGPHGAVHGRARDGLFGARGFGVLRPKV